MRKRDLGILILSLGSIFFSLQRGGEVSLKKIWSVRVDTSLYHNGQFPEEQERLPPPLVTDLDGDGKNEVLICTRQPSLRLYDPPSNKAGYSLEEEVESSAHHALSLRAEASLLPSIRVAKGRQPVAVKSGYLNREDKHQVVVVLTEDWTVLLFDHSLQLLWESTVQRDHPTPPGFYHRAATISILPISLAPGDKGLVVVGGSMGNRQSQHHHGYEEQLDENDEGYEAVNSVDALFKRHFSFYAFDGKRGALRWQHEGSELEEEVKGEDLVEPQHHYKLTKTHDGHTGEVDWRRFRHSLLKSLPHSWHHRDHTRFEPRTFHRHGNIQGRKIKHIDEEDALEEDPNVIVAHVEGGLEVLHLYTGRTLTRLSLREALHADLNGDGVIDHVHAYGGAGTFDITRQAPACSVFVMSGVPPSEPLYNGSLCHKSGVVDRVHFSSIGDTSDQEEVEVAVPAVIHRLKSQLPSTSSTSSAVLFSSSSSSKSSKKGKGSGARQHISTSFESSHVFDTVFLVSNGKVSCYSHQGTLYWQLSSMASWSPSDSLSSSFRPSVTPFLAHPESPLSQVVVLALGYNSLSFLDAEGYILQEAELTEFPISEPTVGDWSNDGYTDVIISTPSAFSGYVQERKVGTGFFTILVACLTMIAVAAFAFNYVSDEGEEKHAHRRLNKRSTD